jgi:hypothetical protein
VIVLLALVVLFVFSTTLSVRGKSFNLVKTALNSQSPQRSWIDMRLAQPVKADEIRLTEGEQGAGCTWDGDRLSAPPGAACHFTIHLSKPHWWQLNSTKRLKLRLISTGGRVDIMLERTGERRQVETIANPGSGSLAAHPSPSTQTPVPPTPTPTPIQLTVYYDPDNQDQDWLLTLHNCLLDGEGSCQVELVK